jgi:hypothetical protein
LTAPVVRRLLQETIVLRGTAVPAANVVVAVAEGGDTGEAIVTGVPLAVGAAVPAGTVLLEVSGRPEAVDHPWRRVGGQRQPPG